ncbi:MAG: hypothetical protein HUU35_11505 [Armatimonadetes bacterium]|nr:hypothetical protein [Armatimonadota bacterium]
MDPNERRLTAAKAEAWRRYGQDLRVSGVGLGEDTVRIYVADESVCEELPRELLGVSVEVVVTGEISAQE